MVELFIENAYSANVNFLRNSSLVLFFRHTQPTVLMTKLTRIKVFMDNKEKLTINCVITTSNGVITCPSLSHIEKPKQKINCNNEQLTHSLLGTRKMQIISSLLGSEIEIYRRSFYPSLQIGCFVSIFLSLSFSPAVFLSRDISVRSRLDATTSVYF